MTPAQDTANKEMNMRVAHDAAVEIEVVTVELKPKEVETENEVHRTIETDRRLMIESRKGIGMTNDVAVRWTDTIAIQVVHELIARKMTNLVDDTEDHHRTAKTHRPKIVTVRMNGTATKNHIIKNRRSTRKSHQKSTTAQMMIVTLRRKRKKVSADDPDPDELTQP